MSKKYKLYYQIAQFTAIIFAIETDFLLTEKQLISSSPCTLALFIIFLQNKQYAPLTFLYLLSLPLSLIHDHVSGLHLLFYIILVLLHALFQNSIFIKKIIPYFLAVSFVIMREIYLYFFTSTLFFIQQTMMEIIFTNALLFGFLKIKSLLCKKK